MSVEKLLTVKEAAQMLGVSKYTLYGWTSARKVPFCKAGSLLRFDLEELKSWTKKDLLSTEKTLDPKV
jgi:excisionase family DNA binding protein